MNSSAQQRPPQTNGHGSGAAQPSVNLSDMLHAIFRRKWILGTCCLVGLIAAGIAFLTMPTLYRSDAKLLVKYVREAKGMDAVDGNSQVKSPDSRGDNIINSELEILSSYDLAREVADVVGAARILRSGGSNTSAAAAIVMKGLIPDVPKKSDVIKISFQHPDPEVTHAVLKALVEAYLKKHIEVHRGVGLVDNFLSQQVDQLRQKVSQTEEALRLQRSKLGVISVDDAKKSYADQLTKLHQEMLAAEAELAELLRAQTNNAAASASTNSIASTNAVAQKEPGKDTVEHYTAIRNELAAARSREVEFSLRYTEESPILQQLRSRIEQLEKSRKNLEAENPALSAIPLTVGPRDKSEGAVQPLAVATPGSLESRLRVLGSQYDKVRKEAAALDEAESNIRALQRTRDTVEANYRYFAQNLEQARIDENLDPGKMPNINKVQEPSPAYPVNQKRSKTIALIFAAIALGGTGLILLVEIFVDQSIRKPSDLEGRFHIPLWVSIPEFGGNGHKSAVPNRLLSLGRRKTTPETNAIVPTGSDLGAAMRPYCEALRDRLVSSFRSRNVNHIPKLIAVTSCGRDSGVTDISTELARTLSENDDGRVLLVRMDHAADRPSLPSPQGPTGNSLSSSGGQGEEAAKTSAISLQPSALPCEDERLVPAVRDGARPEFEIISVNGTNGHQTEQSFRVKLASVISKVKTSQLDYIVFDLPSVGQTSVTPFLADMMDVVLLVVEAEKTPRQSVKRTLSLLENSPSPVAAILNKRRDYLPRWLEPEA